MNVAKKNWIVRSHQMIASTQQRNLILKDLSQVNNSFPVADVPPTDFISEDLFIMTVVSAKSYIFDSW